MPASPATTKALLAASGLVLVVGAGLAIAQPGDLGDDDGDDAAVDQVPTTGTLAPTTTVLGGPTDTSITVPGSDPTTEGTDGTGGTGTTQPGSGIDSDGPSVADDGTAATGIESMLGPGLALVAAAAAGRAAARAAGRRSPA